MNSLLIIFSLLITNLPGSKPLASKPKIEIKVCQHKNCLKQYTKGNLVETFKNLINPESTSSISVESCGCLSGCGKGPNVSIQSKDENIFGAVEDALAAATLLNSECSYKCDNMLIAACDVMAQAEKCE